MAILVIGIVCMHAPKADAATLYYNNAVNTSWSTLGNWWQDSGYTIHALALPTTTDDVFVSASVDSNSGAAASVRSAILDNPFGGSSGRLVIPLSVSQGATFLGRFELRGILTGNATFDYGTNNYGTTTGNATFLDGGTNRDSGVVMGSATFSGDTLNDGYIAGNAIFNDSSYNNGRIGGNATFNDSAGLQAGSNVAGDVILNSDYLGPVPSGGILTVSVGDLVASVIGGRLLGSDLAPFTTYSFIGRSNYATLTGTVTFVDAYNSGSITGDVAFSGASLAGTGTTINGNVIFSGTSINMGTVNGNAVFGDDSTNNSTINGSAQFTGNAANNGTVTHDATFSDGAVNNLTINGNAVFNGTSSNQTSGTVDGDATFNDSSYNGGFVTNDGFFNDASTNRRAVLGDAVFRDSSRNQNGGVQGNAQFWDYSYNDVLATVLGNADFAPTASNLGTVVGTVGVIQPPQPATDVALAVMPGSQTAVSGGAPYYETPAAILASKMRGADMRTSMPETLSGVISGPAGNVSVRYPADIAGGEFLRPLSVGLRSSDVLILQRFLNADPQTRIASVGAGSPGRETSYFGPATRAAIGKFQLKHGIVASPKDVGYGQFGPKTRAKANQMLGKK